MNKRKAKQIAKLINELSALLAGVSIGARVEPINLKYGSSVQVSGPAEIAPLLINKTVEVRFIATEKDFDYPWPWHVSVNHEGVEFMALLKAEEVESLGLQLPQQRSGDPEPA